MLGGLENLTYIMVRRGEKLLTFKNRKFGFPHLLEVLHNEKTEGVSWGSCIMSVALSGRQHHLCRSSDTLPLHLEKS